jgi:hypothetical protein
MWVNKCYHYYLAWPQVHSSIFSLNIYKLLTRKKSNMLLVESLILNDQMGCFPKFSTRSEQPCVIVKYSGMLRSGFTSLPLISYVILDKKLNLSMIRSPYL